MTKFPHYGDMLAIPCFFIAFIYFYKKTGRTMIENFLLMFTLVGLIFDIISTIYFLEHRIMNI